MKNKIKQTIKDLISFITRVIVFIKRKYRESDQQYKQDLRDYYLGLAMRNIRPFMSKVIDDALYDYQHNVNGDHNLSIGDLRAVNTFKKDLIRQLDKYTI